MDITNEKFGFDVRLVKGTFYNAILYGKKDRKGNYAVSEYEFFNAFMKVMTGKAEIETGRNQLNKIKKIKNCSGNSFAEEFNPNRIEDRIRNRFDEVHAAMRAFINDYFAPDRIASVVSILLSLVDYDRTIDGLSFISCVRSDGTFGMVSKQDLLGCSNIDYALLFISIFAYTCHTDNRRGEETFDNWKSFLSSKSVLSKYAGIVDKNGVSIRRQLTLYNSEVCRKEVDPKLHITDYEAFCGQIEDNPDLSRLGNDIDRHRNLYVETQVYRNALQRIMDLDYLMISGAPGSGKTCTSEMIALKMSGLGYRIVYLYGFKQIKNLYEDLTTSKQKEKLFILLDDCMGQAYYELEKQDEASDLQNLVSFVKRNKDHIKLLMNSRTNIISTAMKLRIGESILSDMKATQRFIKAGELTRMEKAKILLRHVVYRSDAEHYKDIGVIDKRCLKIVDHKPFLPRVIDHVTRNYGHEKILNNGDFFNQIINALDNPADVWKKIYEDNKATPHSARVLLEALFSLTNTECKKEECCNVFKHIVSKRYPHEDADSLWYEAVAILNESMITQSIYADVSYISFYDPSVHDYLEQSVFKGQAGMDFLSNDIVYYSQINCIFKQGMKDKSRDFLRKKTMDGSICNLIFESNEKKSMTIIAFVCDTGILRNEYRQYFSNMFKNRPTLGYSEWELNGFNDFRIGVASCLMSSQPLRDFYIGGSIDSNEFDYLLGNIDVKKACELIPFILKSKDAFSFNFESIMDKFMFDAVSGSYADYEDHIWYIDAPSTEDEVSSASRQLNNTIYESCLECISDSELPDSITERFIEILDEYGEENFEDEIKEYYPFDKDEEDDDTTFIGNNSYNEDSDDAILNIFSQSFSYYKDMEE